MQAGIPPFFSQNALFRNQLRLFERKHERRNDRKRNHDARQRGDERAGRDAVCANGDDFLLRRASCKLLDDQLADTAALAVDDEYNGLLLDHDTPQNPLVVVFPKAPRNNEACVFHAN